MCFGFESDWLGKLNLVQRVGWGWRGVGPIHIDIHDIRVHVHVDVHGHMLRRALVLGVLVEVRVVLSLWLFLIHGKLVESCEVCWSRFLLLFFLPHRFEIDVVAFGSHS